MTRHYLTLGLAAAVTSLGLVLPLPLLTGCGRRSEPTQAGPAPTVHDIAAKVSPTDSTPPSQGTFVDADQPPVVLHSFAPSYPSEAIAKKIEATILVRALVGIDGKVKSVSVTSSVQPLLEQPAMDAVRKWEFKPGTKAGKPVEVWVTIPVRFALK